MKKRIAILMLTSLIAACACSLLYSCGTAPAVEFGFPTYGELESVTVQEYANGEPVSREVSFNASRWEDRDPDESAFTMWNDDIHALKQVDEEGKAESTQALRYRLTTTDGTELEFYVYIPEHNASTYFQKADGELWRDTSDNPGASFIDEFRSYQIESFEQAFRAQIEARDFQMLPEYNGTGKALVIEGDATETDDFSNTSYEPGIEFEEVYWDGWDGVASLQLPHYQGYWGEDDYGAIRPEDVRFVVLYEVIDSKIDGHWVDANGNHVSYSHQYTYQGTIYDLLTGESATFAETADSSIFDQAKDFIDKANADS